MQTQKIIYVSLIALLAVSLLIPALSAEVCPKCGCDPCICDEDDDLPSEYEGGLVSLTAEVDKKIVNKPAAGTKEIIHLTGLLSLLQNDKYSGISGAPVYIWVVGPEGQYWERRLIGYTDSEGGFEFYFEITETSNIGVHTATVTAYDYGAEVSFEVVESDIEFPPLQIEYDKRNIVIGIVLGIGFVIVILLYFNWGLRRP